MIFIVKHNIMKVLLEKKRREFGTDFMFEDFISFLKNEKMCLNFENKDIIKELKEKCYSQYCVLEKNTNTYDLKKDVLKRLSFIKHRHNSREGLKERGFNDDEISSMLKVNNRLCVEYWIKRGFTEEYAKKKISEMQSATGKMLDPSKRVMINKDFMQKKYGESYKEVFKKRSVLCKEYWITRGYNEDEATKKIKEIQKKNSIKRKEAAEKDPLKYRESNNKCVEYWYKKGYTEEEAKKIISESQRTFSLEKCIEKYGQDEGYKRWLERQVKWQDSLNKTGFHQLGFSPISQELFMELEKKYPTDDKDYLFYEKKNKEYTLKNDNGFYYRYDFCDLKRRKFIEFNGDIYHGNPLIYNENDKPNPYSDKTAGELWAIDEDKKDVAKRNGFTELVIWEKDYRESKEEIINECINFLLNEK